VNRRTSRQYTKILLQSIILTIFVVSFLYIITSSYYVHVLAQVENNNNTLTLSGLYSKVEKSIVEVTYSNVSTSNLMAPNSTIWPGFVYDKDGHIITLSYGRFQNIYVTFPDHTTYPASLIGSDPATNTTVLQVESIPKTMFFPLPLGNSTELSIGEQVATIGNPYGLSGSLNTGVVSQIGRSVSNPYTGFAAPNAIQTNIPLDPGAIGGPLLNMKGQVVGITVPSFYTYHGTSYGYLHVGFALPSNSLDVIIPSIIKNGTFERPWLGIFTGPISPDLAKSTGLPTNYTGLVVWRVQANSPSISPSLKNL
jgi:S1-C subfamily serine protease